MSSVAILAHRSMLEGGVPYDIPDFTREAGRRLYENDRLPPSVGREPRRARGVHTKRIKLFAFPS